MKCVCCNRLLSDFEATRRSGSTGEYLDTCNRCWSDIDPEGEMLTIDRKDLQHESDILLQEANTYEDEYNSNSEDFDAQDNYED